MEKNLGHATAYGYAKSKGYSGTEEEFAELMADYASVGQSAAQSAEHAAASATSASGSAASASQAAQTATSKASEAVTAADTATTKASEASQSAITASAAATSAGTSAQTATTAAATATTKASEAGESATTASTAKTDAETARDAAAQSASAAAASAASIDPETLEHKAYGAYVVESASGAIASFADGADSIPMKDVLVHIEPVQAGSGDPSPDNVRPITGWTGAKVTRCGKNLINVNSETWNKYNVSGPYWGDNAKQIVKMLNALKPGTYTFTFHEYVDVVNNTGPGTYGIIFRRNVNGVQIDINAQIFNITVAAPKELSKSVTFTLTDNDVGAFTAVYLYAGFPRESTQNSAKFYDFQLELGSTATDYEPYSGDTYSITFPSEAGTVYGGTLDVTSGVLTVTDAQIASYAGETLPGEWISDRDVYVAGTTPTTGAQVVYKLATPITYTLTPQEITSLFGTNNLWADTGDTEVEYRADAKLYITKKITEAVSALS